MSPSDQEKEFTLKKTHAITIIIIVGMLVQGRGFMVDPEKDLLREVKKNFPDILTEYFLLQDGIFKREWDSL